MLWFEMLCFIVGDKGEPGLPGLMGPGGLPGRRGPAGVQGAKVAEFRVIAILQSSENRMLKATFHYAIQLASRSQTSSRTRSRARSRTR